MERSPNEEAEADSTETQRGVVGGTQLFGRFTLQKVLGRGGMGIVWLARDERLERLVALKLVSDAVCFDPSAQEDLKRETRKSLLLTHPNIVRIFDFIEDERTAAISMEYVDGATLSVLRVQRATKCFEVTQVVPWMTSLCHALTYAHESVRVIHRDLKPANLMVNSRSELKVTDFGIACSLRDSMNGVTVPTSSGTLNYMSPQQLLGEDPAPADDIYALGALLFELLSSRPPFFGGDIASQVREVIPPTVTARRSKLQIAGEPIPKHWEETIAACLAKNPARRPQTAAEVARRLRLGEKFQLTDAGPHLPVTTAHLRSHLAAFGAGILCLLVAILILQHTGPKSAETRPVSGPAAARGYAMEVPAANLVPPPAPPSSAAATAEGETVPPAHLPETNSEAGSLQPILPVPSSFTLDLGTNSVAPDPDDAPNQSGNATITSTPSGAEIFLGEVSLGHTPLEVELPLGKQTLSARHPDYPRRTQSVTVTAGTPVKLAFQLRSPSRSSTRKAKPTPPPTPLSKIGNTLKKFFNPKPSPTPRPKKKARR